MSPRFVFRACMRACALALACILLAVQHPALAQSDPAELARAINQAGRQRMLSQRIVKLYCQLGMNVAPGNSRSELAESIALFERQLGDLEASARTPETKATLAHLRRMWPPARAIAEDTIGKDGALRLHAASETLLETAQRLTEQLEDGAARGSLVNLSGRQRMVSQRLAKLYMLRAWGVELPGLDAEMASAQTEFAAALGRLMRAPGNSAEIDRELYAIAVQWEWFRSALSLDGVASYSLVVADASESILRSLERIVGLYEIAGLR